MQICRSAVGNRQILISSELAFVSMVIVSDSFCSVVLKSTSDIAKSVHESCPNHEINDESYPEQLWSPFHMHGVRPIVGQVVEPNPGEEKADVEAPFGSSVSVKVLRGTDVLIGLGNLPHEVESEHCEEDLESSDNKNHCGFSIGDGKEVPRESQACEDSVKHEPSIEEFEYSHMTACSARVVHHGKFCI